MSELAPNQPIARAGELRLRVRYTECDPMGFAHHSAYVAWLEMGRTELLRGSGVTYADMERAGVFLVVTKLTLAYKAPTRYDDQLVVVTNVTGGKRARIDHEYEVWIDAGDGRGKSTLCATASSTLACINREGRPTPLPDWLQAAAHTD
jgi:acyl-CoA thioester hydrolase